MSAPPTHPETSELARPSDFQCLREFRRLKGRAYRPAGRPSRRRTAEEREALASLIPAFSFAPLIALLLELGVDAEPALASGEDLPWEARELADQLVARAERCANSECRTLLAKLAAAHEGLVRREAGLEAPDLIAVPGSRTLSRAVEASRLWRGLDGAPRIALSGGVASYDHDHGEVRIIREADAYAACLRLSGVDDGALLLEREARSTRQNARLLGDAIEQERERLGRPLHLLLCTTGFHTTRYLLSVRREHSDNPAVASIAIAPAPSFLPETLAFDEGGQLGEQKVAIVLNEYFKLHFDLNREQL